MSGLLKQIDFDCMIPYNDRNWPDDSIRLLASNAVHFYTQQGIITPAEMMRLSELIDSPDIGNITVALSILEAKKKLSTQILNQDVSNIQSSESQI